MGQKEVAKKVKELSEGILGSAVDLMLFSIYFGFEYSLAGYSARGWKADEKALNTLSEINYQTIKRSLYYLKQKGLISTVKQKVGEEFSLPQITKEGKERIKSIIPKYREKRTWDGRIYLITYDLPVEKNIQRDNLRDYLKKIGCGALQKSVWVTPYNPKRLIEEFVNENNLDDELILVSSLKKEGAIGNMSLSELLEKVYKLDELNEKYEDFINLVEGGVLKTKEQIAFSYLAILRDDPQIPFKLLPYEWKGNKAYEIFKKYVEKN